MIRFWDTSALVKLYSAAEAGHREVVRLLHGPRARKVSHATSMIAVVELVAALVRRTGNRALATAAARQLGAFSQVEFTNRHRDQAVRLALSGTRDARATAPAGTFPLRPAISPAPGRCRPFP